MCGRDITQQSAGITGIKDRGERGTFGERPHQPILKRLKKGQYLKVAIGRAARDTNVVSDSEPVEGNED